MFKEIIERPAHKCKFCIIRRSVVDFDDGWDFQKCIACIKFKLL